MKNTDHERKLAYTFLSFCWRSDGFGRGDPKDGTKDELCLSICHPTASAQMNKCMKSGLEHQVFAPVESKVGTR